MRGGDRVRTRQPRVQRHEPGLRPHPHEGGDRDRDLRARPRLDCAFAAERSRVGEEQHRDPRARAQQVCERDVDVHRAPGLPVVPPHEDDRRRHERHQLPGSEECQRIARAENERQHEQEDAGEPGNGASPRVGREIARGEHERGSPDETEHEEEVAAQGVDADPRFEHAGERGAELLPGCEHPDAGQADQRDADRLGAEARQERPGREGECAPDPHHDDPCGEKRPDHEAPTLPLRRKQVRPSMLVDTSEPGMRDRGK